MGDPEIGSTLAGYRLDEEIARGGMGVVYRATHLALERPVALKVIARHLASDQSFRERFLRESRLAARLDHPSVVPVFDAREEDGELIVAMRLVEGGNLKRRIAEQGPLPAERALDLLAQIAAALDAAHAAGIVHRDVKPHNILLEGDRAFLSDFGLAKALGDSGVLSGTSVVGTVEYMSPEQWRGQEVGPPADVYSLGCVLYESVTGIVPYARRAGEAEPQMPAGLDAVIERAVAKDPGDRYPSAGALIGAARERQDATPATTRVLSEGSDGSDGRTGTIAMDGGPGLGERLRRIGGLPGWLLTAGLLAALAAALFLLLDGDDVSVSEPIAVGDGPLRLAAADGSVWVTSAGEGTLSRISAGAERVDFRKGIGRGVSGVAFGEGSVWVSSPRTHSVLRLEPSGRLAARVPVGGRPGAIVVSGGRVWVADEAGNGVTAINPAGDRVFKAGIVPRAAPLRLAAGAGGIWVSSASTGTVRRIDWETATAGAPITVGRGPAGVTVGGGRVWVANSRADGVSRIDSVTGLLLGEPIAVGDRPGGIDAGTELVWVANSGDGTVTRIDIDNGEVVGDAIDVGPRPGAVAVGREAVWVANNADGTVTRIEP
jgi:serine/threonine-protein kinase